MEKKREVKGVSCDVINCAHNCGGVECTAREIHVGGDCCTSCSDTNCATFKAKG